MGVLDKHHVKARIRPYGITGHIGCHHASVCIIDYFYESEGLFVTNPDL